jgi:rSAM/selenodomain-associated transferase 2
MLPPAMADEQCSRSQVARPAVSIIVPVWNEAALIRSFLVETRRRAPGAEIVVVDGGSSDKSAALAESYCDRLLLSERGRALQMNAGARAASGEILWFLHVDVQLPSGCLEQIGRAMNDVRAVGGFFRIRLPGSRFIYRLTDSFAHYAGIFLRMRCGDHGIFCRRKVFDEIGGFPEVPLMEDVEFFRRLRRRGRVIIIPERLVASSRRYEAIGRCRLTFAYALIAALYVLKVPLSRLGQLYARICCR